MMQQYKMIVAYDGTNYHGWQLQNNKPTIAGVLSDQFQKVFGRQIILAGASRTDAGVHALGQVVSFKTDLNINSYKFKQAWNGRLPQDIHIRSIEPVADNFYSQRNVCQKIYWYHVFPQRPLPFFARYGLYYRFPFNPEQLQEALQLFVGTHDFRSFCTGDEKMNTIRTVDAISMKYIKQYGAYRIIVQGQGFLRYMIRRMIGAALHVATYQHLSIDDIIRVRDAKDPLHCLPTAPAHGLILRKIEYH